MQQWDKTKNKVYPICNMTFTKEFNHNHQVLKLHKGEIDNDSLESLTSDEKNKFPSFVPDDNNVIAESFPEKLKSSFLIDDDEIIDVNLSIVDHQT